MPDHYAKSDQFSELLGAVRDSSHTPSQIDQYRFFCYGFRSGGFMDAAKIAVQGIGSDGDRPDCLTDAITSLSRIIRLRGRAIPLDNTDDLLVKRFCNYVQSYTSALENLEKAAQEVGEAQCIYEGFKAATERVTNSNGLYVLNWDDPFLLGHGSVDLPLQGLKIVQTVFANNISLNYAIVSPGKEFYHSHEHLSEFHFVEVKCPYEHWVDGKSFQVKGADVVSMVPNIPHGGRNTSDTEEVRLGFFAGSLTHGPWRADFNDRTNRSKDTTDAQSIQELNGALLDEVIERLSSRADIYDTERVFPPTKADDLGLLVANIGRRAETVKGPNRDGIIKVLRGEGKVTIGDIEVDLKPQDAFSFPSGIEGTLQSENGMILLNFY